MGKRFINVSNSVALIKSQGRQDFVISSLVLQ